MGYLIDTNILSELRKDKKANAGVRDWYAQTNGNSLYVSVLTLGETFGHAKLAFLKQYLPFENGIPSDDTFRRFFRAIAPEKFQELFVEWVRVWLNSDVAEKVIAIDGKRLRGSHDGNQWAIHMVSAFASEVGIVLGQMKTQEKSNEINAIPELLDWIDICGAIVTIDAAGCQNRLRKKSLKAVAII